MANLAQEIVESKQLEANARKSVDLLDRYTALMRDMQNFIKSTGNPPQDPVPFCQAVLCAFAKAKLESKIITLGE